MPRCITVSLTKKFLRYNIFILFLGILTVGVFVQTVTKPCVFAEKYLFTVLRVYVIITICELIVNLRQMR